MNGRLLVDRRDAHQAGDIQLQVIAAHRYKGSGLLWRNACLLRFLAGVDLNEELERLGLLCHFSSNGFGDLDPVDRVDCIEQLHRLLDLVRL